MHQIGVLKEVAPLNANGTFTVPMMLQKDLTRRYPKRMKENKQMRPN